MSLLLFLQQKQDDYAGISNTDIIEIFRRKELLLLKPQWEQYRSDNFRAFNRQSLDWDKYSKETNDFFDFLIEKYK